MPRKIKIQSFDESLENTLRENMRKAKVTTISGPEKTIVVSDDTSYRSEEELKAKLEQDNQVKKEIRDELEKAKEIVKRIRNENVGDANAYTNKDDNSTVVNIHDIKIKNLVERFNDIILDITTDDFTDDMSIDEKNIKYSRQKGIILEEDFQNFLDVINIEKFDEITDVPEYIYILTTKLHGNKEFFHRINVFLELTGYYNFLINKLFVPIENITENSYLFKLADKYISNYNKSEFDVPDEDLNKLSETAGTNYNIIKDKIDEINNRPNDYAKCREYYNSVDTLIARNKANKDSSRFNKNDCTRIKPINDVTEEFKQARVIGNAFKTFRDENGVTKYGSLKDVDKVLNSLEKIDENQPGELLLSIPQDYEAPSIIAKVNPCNMENNNTHYEEVNHPDHYNVYDVEVVEMMERIFGIEETMSWCKLNAFKYRMRAGEKPTSTVEKDLKKEKWCLNKYKELKSKK